MSIIYLKEKGIHWTCMLCEKDEEFGSQQKWLGYSSTSKSILCKVEEELETNRILLILNKTGT